jgi:hypothetical protein
MIGRPLGHQQGRLDKPATTRVASPDGAGILNRRVRVRVFRLGWRADGDEGSTPPPPPGTGPGRGRRVRGLPGRLVRLGRVPTAAPASWTWTGTAGWTWSSSTGTSCATRSGRRCGRRFFIDVSRQGGPFFATAALGRGVAVGDLDNDGRPDLVVSHSNSPVVLLRNEGVGTPAWVGVQLAGRDHRPWPCSTGTEVRERPLFSESSRFLLTMARGGIKMHD